MNSLGVDPLNAFSEEYLTAVREQDEPSTAHEADTSGPFTLVEQDGMLALFHAWESAERRDLPQAVFHHRETALLFQAIWPAAGRSRLFRLRQTADDYGFGLEQEGQLVGSLRNFDPDVVSGGHFVSHLTRSPHSLALLVEASGPLTQRHLGRLLATRLQTSR